MGKYSVRYIPLSRPHAERAIFWPFRWWCNLKCVNFLWFVVNGMQMRWHHPVMTYYPDPVAVCYHYEVAHNGPDRSQAICTTNILERTKIEKLKKRKGMDVTLKMGPNLFFTTLLALISMSRWSWRYGIFWKLVLPFSSKLKIWLNVHLFFRSWSATLSVLISTWAGISKL